MRRAKFATAAAVATTAAALVTFSIAAAEPKNPGLLRYQMVASGGEGFVDNDPAGPSVGDTFVFGDDVFDGAKHVGHATGACTVAAIDPPENQCVGSFTFGDGTLHFVAGDDGPPDLPLVIVGGTGRYAGTSGTALVRLVDDDAGTSSVEIRLSR